MTGDALIVGTTVAAVDGLKNERAKIIFASSLGTLLEWYDFFLYGALAPTIAAQFFGKIDLAKSLFDYGMECSSRV
jgi:hypothetical protein